MGRPVRRLALAFAVLAAAGTGGCSLHPAEGAAAGAAGGAVVGAVTSTSLLFAVPAGAVVGGGAVSLFEGYRANRAKCQELRRCVY